MDRQAKDGGRENAGDRRAALDRLIRRLGDDRQKGAAPAPGIVRRSEGTSAPASYGQERLFLLDRLEPGSTAYHIAGGLRLEGSLDVAALAAALAEIVRRHEALRTHFEERDGTPWPVVVPAGRSSLSIVDLAALAPEHRTAEARLRREAEARQTFDLEHGPLFRTLLIRSSRTEHVLVVVMHHIVADGWSLGVFLRELEALYRAAVAGTASPLAKPPVQFGDVALWQRRDLAEDKPADEKLTQLLDGWRRRLEGTPPLELLTDRPRPATPSGRGGSLPVTLAPAVVKGLGEVVRGRGATLFAGLAAAWGALLGRLSGQTDFAVGTVTANRRLPEVEGLVGFFVNTLALRLDLGGAPSFEALVEEVKKIVLEADARQDVSFEKVVEAVDPGRDRGTSPLFQTMLVLQNAPLASRALDLPELSTEAFEIFNGGAKFDLHLSLAETSGTGLEGSLEFARDLFDETTARRLWHRFECLVAEAVTDPRRRVGVLDVLGAGERHQLLREWNDTTAAYAETTLPAAFEAQVDRTPDAPALVFGDVAMTYRELDAAANRLAHRLLGLGVGREHAVGVAMERSVEMVVALYGIMKAGGFYVPVDPANPDDRLALILEELGRSVVLTQVAFAPRLAALAPEATILPMDSEIGIRTESAERPGATIDLDQTAYMIYTSGSTGRPKGTIVSHRAISNRLEWAGSAFPVGTEDRVVQKTPYAFDVSVWEFFWPHRVGSCLVVAAPEAHRDPARIVETIREHGATVVHFVPSMLQLFCEEPGIEDLETLRFVFASGEALPAELAARLLKRFGGRGVRLENLYGPTEAAVEVTRHLCDGVEDRVPIGRPIANTTTLVLDRRGRLTSLDAPGELHLGGVQLARGYSGRPALTAERFVPDAFAATPGARLYRTGDLCRVLPNGEIDFLGRIDFQIKLRGVRIELGEIEAALADLEAVREAVVGLRRAGDGPDGEELLAAYVVPSAAVAGTALGDPTTFAEMLRSELRSRLPEAMVPSACVVLEAMPLSPNGKADRKALARCPVPVLEGTGSADAAPRTAAEETIAEIWRGVLSVEKLGVQDDFFALGGHSLLASRALARMREAFGVDLPLRRFFDEPTVAKLAAAVEAARGDARGTGDEPLLAARQRGDEAPLSFAQERLVFLARLRPESPVYNIPAAVRLAGPLDADTLAGALGEILRRHEALRTVFPERPADPVQRALEPPDEPLTRVDLSTSSHPEAELGRCLGEESRRAFDLAAGPLFRATLFVLRDDEHVLFVDQHHAISDGWSIGIFLDELETLYAAAVSGETAELPELPELTVQVADHAVWQREYLTEEVVAERVEAWRELLAGAPPLLELPADRPRPEVPSLAGWTVRRRLAPGVAAALEGAAEDAGATLFQTLLAAFDAFLYRLTGQSDLVVGTPLSGRDRVELEPLIGLFVNTVAVRVDLGGGGGPSFRDAVARTRDAFLATHALSDLPFDRVVEALQPERSLAQMPIYQVMFALQTVTPPRLELPGIMSLRLPLDTGTSKFDLTAALRPLPDGGLEVELEAARDLFDRTTVLRFAEAFALLLADAGSSPGRSVDALAILPRTARHQVLVEWGRPAADGTLPKTPLGELFEAMAVEHREAPAVFWRGADDAVKSWTYGELEARSADLARRLAAAGVGRETPVGLSLERSADFVLAVVATIRAGGSYVPLDPSYPEERLRLMKEDAGVEVVLGGGDPLSPGERGLGGEDAFSAGQSLDDRAYVVYTSGSTGRPKGIEVSHLGVVRLVRSTDYVDLRPGHVVAHASNVSFDAATYEIWGALCNGAGLAVIPPTVALEPTAFRRELRDLGVSHLFLTTALFNECIRQAPDIFETLEHVCFGGEAVDPRRVRELLDGAPPKTVLHVYGPTENTTFSTWYPIRDVAGDARTVPIGRPIGHSRHVVVDRRGRFVVAGAAGELWLGGDGLARGYLGQSARTAERFVPDPFGDVPGGRLYRTGDRVRQDARGDILFLGRLDHQVKLRGLRIELGEIEAALLKRPEVRDTVVVVAGTDDGGTAAAQLVAYVVPSDGAGLETGALRAELGRELPEFMVPRLYVELAELPLTPNGKLDRAALPPPPDNRAADAPYVAPESKVEETIAEVFRRVLDVEQVGRDDNFFELGGTSLLLTRVAGELRAAFEREVAIVDLFRFSTVRTLAEHVGEDGEDKDGDDKLADVDRQVARRRKSMGRRRRRRREGF